MQTTKQLGIWMDHSNANLIELTADPMQTRTIASQFTHEVKESALTNSESLMHNKEQHEQTEYYNKLGSEIRSYNEVLLFGPTDAKVELLNHLRADHRFANIKIEVKPTDKMSEKEQHLFVRDYFSK